MSSLTKQSCQPINKGSPPLEQQKINEYLPQVALWQNINNEAIERDFKFKDYYQTMAFVNQVADVAHQCDHHPDMLVGYNHCKITYTTHAVNGLSINDFISAAKIDCLLDN